MAAPIGFIRPELATLVDAAPAGDTWFHEIKYDGYRIAGRLKGGKVSLLTRRGLDWTDRFRAIADDLLLLKRRDIYIDGEIVALTAAGVSDFGGLQEALSSSGSRRDGLVYFVFDLLHLAGKDLRGEPLRGIQEPNGGLRAIAIGGEQLAAFGERVPIPTELRRVHGQTLSHQGGPLPITRL